MAEAWTLIAERDALKAKIGRAHDLLAAWGGAAAGLNGAISDLIGELHGALQESEQARESGRLQGRREMDLQHGPRREPCVCPGCPATVPVCWVTPMCRPCAGEDCEHGEEGSPPAEVELDSPNSVPPGLKEFAERGYERRNRHEGSPPVLPLTYPCPVHSVAPWLPCTCPMPPVLPLGEKP